MLRMRERLKLPFSFSRPLAKREFSRPGTRRNARKEMFLADERLSLEPGSLACQLERTEIHVPGQILQAGLCEQLRAYRVAMISPYRTVGSLRLQELLGG